MNETYLEVTISHHNLLKLVFNYLEIHREKAAFKEVYLKSTGIFHVLSKLQIFTKVGNFH